MENYEFKVKLLVIMAFHWGLVGSEGLGSSKRGHQGDFWRADVLAFYIGVAM